MGWGGGGGAGAHSSSAKQTATTPMGEWYTWLMYPSFRTDERCPGSVDAFANCRENMTKTSFAVLRWKKPREESSAACDSMTGPSLPGASVPGLNTAENRIFMRQGGSGADRRGVRAKRIFTKNLRFLAFFLWLRASRESLGVHRAPRCEPVVSIPLIVLPKSCSCRCGPCPPPYPSFGILFSFFLSRHILAPRVYRALLAGGPHF